MKKRVSIVIPVYNEEEVLDELARCLTCLMERHQQYDFEVIFVENGSADRSFEKMEALNKHDNRFKILQLSRNFMADGGVAAGLQYASGDCAIIMDADLQDPPEVVDLFFKEWEAGAEVVYGVIDERRGVSKIRKSLNAVFYRLLEKFTKGTIPPNVTAFRLMDKKVYQHLNRMQEANRFTRGLCSWTGFVQKGVVFQRAERFAGESKAPLIDISKEAIDALFSFSFIPLRIISFSGIFLSVFCFLFLVFQIAVQFFYGSVIPGYRTLMVVLLLMFGCLFVFLGILGEYIARIFDEVKRRPNYIVYRKVGLEKSVINDDYLILEN